MYLWSTWTQASATSGVGAGAFRRRRRRRALSKSFKVGACSAFTCSDIICARACSGGRCANLSAWPICATLSPAGAWSPCTNHVMTSPVCDHFHFCWHSIVHACTDHAHRTCQPVWRRSSKPFLSLGSPGSSHARIRGSGFDLAAQTHRPALLASTPWTHVVARAHGQLAAWLESGGVQEKIISDTWKLEVHDFQDYTCA